MLDYRKTVHAVVFALFYVANAFAMEEVKIPAELRNLSYGIYPDSAEYNTARLNYNKRFQYFPKAIFAPTNHDEIRHVFSVLKRHHLRFAIRSGKHCLEPGSLSSDYIIDLSKFNAIRPDYDHDKVYIGAGAQLGRVIAKLGETNHAIPTGTCPTVGVSGLALGGGIGLLCRQKGLTCDAVESITMLNADGEVINIDETHYHNLFWALRGGGNGSYGIVLGWNFNVSCIPEASFYELMWEYSPELIAPIIDAWQEWVATLSTDITSVLAIRHPNHFCADPENSPPTVIRIFGLKIGSEPFTEWQTAFSELNPQVKVFTGGYGELSQYWAKESDLPFVKSKSRILMEPIQQNTIDLITEFFNKLDTKNPNYLIYFELEAFGGAMRDTHTAFFPRDAFAWWYQAYYWPEQVQSPEVLALANEFYAKIPSNVSEYCYSNIVDYDLGKSYLHRYYGDHVDRLVRTKKRNDPTNLFHWHQSIPLTLPHTEGDSDEPVDNQ